MESQSHSAGWHSDLQTFSSSNPNDIQEQLELFVGDFSIQQEHAWKESIPMIQNEGNELIHEIIQANEYGILLEYQLPYELRRPDFVVLAEGSVVVLELKGKTSPTQADIDQVAAYARDLRAYHRECENREVLPVLVPTRSIGTIDHIDGVYVSSPDKLDELIGDYAVESGGSGPSIEEFIDDDAYRPLPTLVQAARELFHSRSIREIWRARSATDPAVDAIEQIVEHAASTKTRHLILVSGVPGSGKTLVGMRAVHSEALDDFSTNRRGGKPTVPGLYLTGNGPLSEVLQYQLGKDQQGRGQTFVRHIKGYLERYVTKPDRVPPEHLLVFDEAQRAYSADKVADSHKKWSSSFIASEPELFINICDRMPDWSVLIGLIGSGQEIHVGEEEGLVQWKDAVKQSSESWTVHTPSHLSDVFGNQIETKMDDSLNLDVELRFHHADHVHKFVGAILDDSDSQTASDLAPGILSPNDRAVDGAKIYLTRVLEDGKSYLRERYEDYPQARYGILASSRDKALRNHGIANDYDSTKYVKKGPWFVEDESDPRSCRGLEITVTEFDCQGLELDMALVGWGTDLIREESTWTIKNSTKYRKGGRTSVKDRMQLRINAYRVLLTRGRDGTIIFVPPISDLDETYQYLLDCGIPELKKDVLTLSPL